jgi:hypothetical protein
MVVSLSAERAFASELPQSSKERALADFTVDRLSHILACQQVRRDGTSAACHARDGNSDNRTDRKYPSWECCDVHKVLKAERATLQKWANELGIVLRIELDLNIQP